MIDIVFRGRPELNIMMIRRRTLAPRMLPVYPIAAMATNMIRDQLTSNFERGGSPDGKWDRQKLTTVIKNPTGRLMGGTGGSIYQSLLRSINNVQTTDKGVREHMGMQFTSYGVSGFNTSAGAILRGNDHAHIHHFGRAADYMIHARNAKYLVFLVPERSPEAKLAARAARAEKHHLPKDVPQDLEPGTWEHDRALDMKELDGLGSDDAAYRTLYSTGTKGKPPKSWRARAVRDIHKMHKAHVEERGGTVKAKGAMPATFAKKVGPMGKVAPAGWVWLYTTSVLRKGIVRRPVAAITMAMRKDLLDHASLLYRGATDYWRR